MTTLCTFRKFITYREIPACDRPAVCEVRVAGGSQGRPERWAPRCGRHDGHTRKYKPQTRPLVEA